MRRVIQQIITGPFFVNTRSVSGPAMRVSAGTGYPLTEGSFCQLKLGKNHLGVHRTRSIKLLPFPEATTTS